MWISLPSEDPKSTAPQAASTHILEISLPLCLKQETKQVNTIVRHISYSVILFFLTRRMLECVHLNIDQDCHTAFRWAQKQKYTTQ